MRDTTWYLRLGSELGKDQTMEATEVDIQAYEDSDERAPHAVTCAIENVNDLGVSEDDPTYWTQVLDMARSCVEAGDFDHLLTPASQPGVEPREGVRHSHSYGAVECVTGAETVAAEAFATGAGLGRVGLFVTRLNGQGVFASFTPDDANRLAHDLLEASVRAKGYQLDALGHDKSDERDKQVYLVPEDDFDG